jgi:hypothetical protein
MKLDKSDIIKLSDRTVITTNGDYPTSVFKERFSPDRYGDEAFKKANKYGRSLIGTKISVEELEFEITGFEVMVGSCDYVGSLLLLVEEL